VEDVHACGESLHAFEEALHAFEEALHARAEALHARAEALHACAECLRARKKPERGVLSPAKAFIGMDKLDRLWSTSDRIWVLDRKMTSQDTSGNRSGIVPVVIATAALAVSIISAYLSLSALQVNKKAARAQLFSNFQQQYGVIASQFPANIFDPSWHPPVGSEDWWKLKRYWDLCYVEWYATQKLHPELYGSLWKTFYAEVIGDALDYPSLRGVLIELMQRQQRDKAPHKNLFYEELRARANEKGLSLQPKSG